MSLPIADPSLISDVEQGTDEWLAERRGKVTGSEVKNVIAWKYPKPTKKNPEPEPEEKAERITYRMNMVSEMLIGELGKKEMFITDAMKWGTANEGIARMAYQLQNKVKVVQRGLINHPTIKAAHSPDGLVGDDGMIEIKCLEPWNHLYKIVKQNEMPDVYMPQVQMGMWLWDRQWCDFIGYDSRQAPGLDMFSVRIERDQDYINMLEAECIQFLAEVKRDFNHYLRYLPTCERICRNCGSYFIEKLSICKECKTNNSEVVKVLEPAEISLRRVDNVQKDK